MSNLDRAVLIFTALVVTLCLIFTIQITDNLRTYGKLLPDFDDLKSVSRGTNFVY